MRVACLIAAGLAALVAVPAAAADLLVSRASVAADAGPVALAGRDGRVRVTALEDGADLKVSLDIDAVALRTPLRAGVTLADRQRFSIRIPSRGDRIGETVTLLRAGEEVRVVVTRPTEIDAMRAGPAQLAAATETTDQAPALSAAPR